MKRIHLYVAGIVVALVPAIVGLAGNASFSQTVPLQQPATVSSDDPTSTPSSTPSSSPSDDPTPDGDDDRRRGRGGSDDGPNHDVGDDDNSGPGNGGEDNSGSGSSGRGGSDDGPNHDVGDDRGGDRDRGGDDSSGPGSGGSHDGPDDGSDDGSDADPTTATTPAATTAATTVATTTVGPVATDPTTDLRAAESGGRTQEAPSEDITWRTVASPEREPEGESPLRTKRVVAQLALGVVVVLAVVTIGGSLAARRLAEREAVNDAANIADVFAESVIRPQLTDRLAAGNAQARASFDELVRAHVLGPSVVHVKLWSPDGTVVYADERALVGQTFELDAEQRAALEDPQTHAEISDLERDENTLDRTAGDKLVEVYRPVWTPTGKQMLFEIYAPYDQVGQRTGQLWRGFAGVTLSSLLLFLVLLTPLFWHLLTRVRRHQRQRELLLERSVDASSNERRQIAASLHDGPVQDLAATSFVVAGATARAKAAGQHGLVEELQTVSGSVRTSIRALRSLLVDIYPASLGRAGLGAALADLVQSVRAPGLEVRLHHDDEEQLGLTPDQERTVYRIAQETLRNAAKHAVPCTASLTLYRVEDEAVLDVLDDGSGFDVDAQLAEPRAGHFGLQLLADIATSGGALLQVASVPGRGTHWRLRVPVGDGTRREDEEGTDD